MKVVKGAFLRCGSENDIAAFSAVATVRSAPGDELFPPKAHTAGAPVTGLDSNRHFIDEFHST